MYDIENLNGSIVVYTPTHRISRSDDPVSELVLDHSLITLPQNHPMFTHGLRITRYK